MKYVKTLAVFFFAMLSALTLASTTSMAANYETENNNSYTKANKLGVSDSIIGNMSKVGDKDYYKITPAANGKLNVNFNHKYDNSTASWTVAIYLYNKGKYEQLEKKSVRLKDDETFSLPYVGVTKGKDYYVYVTSPAEATIGVNYTVKTSFTASDYFEKEFNNSYATATSMVANSTYSGTINVDPESDYYQVVPSSDGKLNFTFHHTYFESNASWTILTYLYEDGNYLELTKNYVTGKSNEHYALPTIGVKKGSSYFIKVSSSSPSMVGVNYSITNSVTATPFYEREFNNTFASADVMGTNTTYGASLMSISDCDVFRVVAPQNGVFTTSFTHSFVDNAACWTVNVYRYINGNYSEISKKFISLKDNQTVSLPNIGVEKGAIYFVKVSTTADVTVGKDYTLRVNYKPGAPSKVKASAKKKKIKLSWKKVTGATKYQIRYRIGKKGKTKKITPTKKASYTLKKTKKKKTYYFEIRTITVINGTTYYSDYKKFKKVKAK